MAQSYHFVTTTAPEGTGREETSERQSSGEIRTQLTRPTTFYNIVIKKLVIHWPKRLEPYIEK